MTTLETSGLNALLQQNSYIRAWDELKAEANLVPVARTSVAKRAEDWKNALAVMDQDKLDVMQEKMFDFVDLITKQEIKFDELPKELDGEQRVVMMKSALMVKEIKEFLDVYYEFVRSTVFNVLTERASARGADDPEHEKGEIQVLSLGKRFCKEGGNRKDPVVKRESDEDGPGLHQLLGEKLWNEITEVEIIPEKRITNINYEKLMELAVKNPEDQILEKIRATLIPGLYNSNSFAIRDIKQETREK